MKPGFYTVELVCVIVILNPKYLKKWIMLHMIMV